MARQRKRPEAEEPALSMTPMIDVVFQLLIYFIVTIKPIDVVTNLDVFRPAPDKSAPKDTPPPNLVRLGVYKDGYTVNEVAATLPVLDQALARLAALDANQTIMITVSAFSEHGQLIKALDLCAKNGLKSLSIVSASN
ncbi:MAG TPA: biopolymer transporter ExbD [Kiritimatiellia bacterium]|jgi:biopolymer transport protein ExbD|nr:biopolymer transporter ExbD [Lentisphaerota bacterium]HRV31256.1 biopolymer transporter ExbD [Kiritimatiellia bacterium]